jgi:cytoskeletal protein CcmA (bactofilin family)
MAAFSNDKKAKNIGPDQLNRLVNGTVLSGNINTPTSFRIDGYVEGNVQCGGKLVLGTEGEIKGNLSCVDAEIEGTITGDLFIQNLLFLRASSVINGNIKTTKLVIENGAAFNGNCKMHTDVLNEKNKFETSSIQEEEKSDLVY